jgi:lipoate-protein ligase A
MALDEALLEEAAGKGLATLRFYQWNEPTLSLGYFQAIADRQSHAASLGCPIVRRHSGGGAILHDRELTYSLALPALPRFTRDPHALYLAVHRSLRETLAELSGPGFVGAIELCPQTIRPTGAAGEPFLCFRRRAYGDLLVRVCGSLGLPQTVDGAHKVTGSSQRKRRGAVLQHGSILLAQSDRATELPGLAELVAKRVEAGEVVSLWAPRIAETLGLGIAPSTAHETTMERAKLIAKSKFAQSDWTARR